MPEPQQNVMVIAGKDGQLADDLTAEPERTLSERSQRTLAIMSERSWLKAELGEYKNT